MKKSLLILCAALGLASLTAFKHFNKNQKQLQCKENTETLKTKAVAKANFYYAVDSRFLKTVTKVQVQNALTIYDLFSVDDLDDLIQFEDLTLELLPREASAFEKGDGALFTPAQRKLLNSAEYGTDFCIKANCKRRINNTDETVNYDFVYYIAIVPEKEAVYKNGHTALLDYLKNNSKKEAASVEQTLLKPGKIKFLITKKGELKNAALESTSGYKAIDHKMIELITHLPENWEPATNEVGEKIEQQLIFAFGKMGC